MLAAEQIPGCLGFWGADDFITALRKQVTENELRIQTVVHDQDSRRPPRPGNVLLRSLGRGFFRTFQRRLSAFQIVVRLKFFQ